MSTKCLARAATGLELLPFAGQFFDWPAFLDDNLSMKILIVEDDQKVASFLKENLSRESYNLSSIYSMSELQSFIADKPFTPDLFILDRLLENHDSRTAMKSIKATFPTSRILCLSALNSPSEKAALLDEGADDYLGKPFSLIELQARVKTLLRRRDESSNNYYINVGDIIIDLRARSIMCQGKKINLKNKEYALLINFSQNLNRVFSKYELLDIIWETNLDVESNVLEVTIMNLRKKLNDSNSSLNILSKRNVGYWLEA